MTSPRVIELPRRLEPVARDTFLGAVETGAPPRAVSYLGNVVALRPRDGRGLRRPPAPPPLPTAA
jgi:hypothetical protein